MGLSSNVMNMKFMQKAQDRSKAEEQQAETKKVKDSSEWSLPSSAIRPKSKPSVTIRTVGYGSIASLTAKDDDEEQQEATPLSNPAVTKATDKVKQNEAEQFLSGILEKASKDKKRSQKQEKRPRKKAKTSLS